MLNKHEFAQRYIAASGAQLTQREAAAQIDRMWQVLAEVLHEEGTYRVQGFGTWVIRQRAARKGKNPQTGEPMKIKASRTVVFKAATALRERVQKAARQAKPKAA
jgi:DNA-binding protein HU-beta